MKMFSFSRYGFGKKIRVRDFYVDCNYHPVLCIESDYRNDYVGGISLIDGSMPRSCSPSHCDPERISARRAIEIKRGWNVDDIGWEMKK